MVICIERRKTRTCEYFEHFSYERYPPFGNPRSMKASKYLITGLGFLPKALMCNFSGLGWMIRIPFVLTDKLMQTGTENNWTELCPQNQHPGSLSSNAGGGGLRNRCMCRWIPATGNSTEPRPPLQCQKANTIREEVQCSETASQVSSLGFLTTLPRFSNNKAVLGCPTFWCFCTTLEGEELSWATH